MTRPTDDENQLEKAQQILGRFETRRAEAMCALMTIIRQLYNENAELRARVKELEEFRQYWAKCCFLEQENATLRERLAKLEAAYDKDTCMYCGERDGVRRCKECYEEEFGGKKE